MNVLRSIQPTQGVTSSPEIPLCLVTKQQNHPSNSSLSSSSSLSRDGRQSFIHPRLSTASEYHGCEVIEISSSPADELMLDEAKQEQSVKQEEKAYVFSRHDGETEQKEDHDDDDDDDDEEEDCKEKLFSRHLSQYENEDKEFLAQLLALRRPKAKSKASRSKRGTKSEKVDKTLAGTTLEPSSSKMEDLAEINRIYSAGEVPDLPDSVLPVLRLLSRCPLCLLEFPKMKVEEDGVQVSPVKKRARKSSTTSASTKIAGPAKLEHVRLCALQKQSPLDVVLSLIERDHIRYNKAQRQAHIEEQSNEGLWKMVTGEAPPCTQIQNSVAKLRESGSRKRKIEYYVRDSMQLQQSGKPIPEGKGAATKRRKLAGSASGSRRKHGVRGGIDRLSTTIVAPCRIIHEIKARCQELFGQDQSDPQEMKGSRIPENHQSARIMAQYDFEGALSHSHFFNTRKGPRGLGIGACCTDPNDERAHCAITRLGMGAIFAESMMHNIKKQG